MRCSIFIATSVDGFVAGPNDELDWLASVERPDEDPHATAFVERMVRDRFDPQGDGVQVLGD